MRVFIALVLPEPFKRKLMEATAVLCAQRSALRWVPTSQLHLTLAFLGDLDERGIDIATEAAERTALSFDPFALSCAGLLALPRRGAARILAASIGEGARQAADLADSLESALAGAARETAYPLRPRESRPFTAHVTLARAGHGAVAFTEEELGLRIDAAERVSAFAVYESLLGSGGARYRELARMALGTPPYAR